MLNIVGIIIEFLSSALHVFLGERNVCNYQPTCSHYAREALVKHGFLIGALKIFFRVLRCHPFAKGGPDPA